MKSRFKLARCSCAPSEGLIHHFILKNDPFAFQYKQTLIVLQIPDKNEPASSAAGTECVFPYCNGTSIDLAAAVEMQNMPKKVCYPLYKQLLFFNEAFQ